MKNVLSKKVISLATATAIITTSLVVPMGPIFTTAMASEFTVSERKNEGVYGVRSNTWFTPGSFKIKDEVRDGQLGVLMEVSYSGFVNQESINFNHWRGIQAENKVIHKVQNNSTLKASYFTTDKNEFEIRYGDVINLRLNGSDYYLGEMNVTINDYYNIPEETTVDQLFKDNTKDTAIIKLTTTQANIDAAKAQVEKLINSNKKTKLQDALQLAQNQVDKQGQEYEANQYNAIQQELGNLIENPAFKLTESSTAVDKWGLYRNNVAVSNASTSITLQQSVDTDGNIPTTNESIKMKNGAQAGELQGYIKDDNMLIVGQTLKTIANHKYRLTANHTGKSAVVLYDGTNVFSGSKGGLGDKYSNGVNQRVELVFTAKSAATSVGNRFISDKSGNWQVFGMSDFQVFDITEEDNQEKAREAVNSLFTNKDPNGTITETVTQAEIDAAQALINNVTDPAKKAALQADLNKAQSQLDANQYNAIQKELGNLVENPAFELTESSTAVDKWGLYRNNVAVSNASTSITLQQSVDTDGNIPTTNESIKMKNGAQAGELQGYIKDDNMLIMGQTLKTIANHKYRLTANHTGKSAVVLYDGTNVFSGSKGGLGDKYSNGVNQRVELVFTAKSAATSVGNRFISDKSGNWQVFGMSNFQVFDITEEDNQEKAREAVNSLFTNKDPNGTITETVTQAEIDAAQALINNVTDPEKKAALQADLNKAQSQLDAKTVQAEAESKAREAVNNLFTNKDPNGTITGTMTQAEIDAAQALINKVTDPAKKAALQADLNKAQSQLDTKVAQAEAESKAREAVNNLFTNKDPNGTITGTMTQAEIDAAQALINKVTDPAKKAALQADLNKAQSQLDAKVAQAEAESKAREAVNNLFTNKDPNGTITGTMTQAEIDAAQTLINNVTDPEKKAALQADLNKAQSQLDAKTVQAEAESKAREAVNNLFTNKDPNGTITGTMTQAEIDAAQALINKVTDPAKKAALQADLNKAQSQLDEKQAKLVAPTIHPFVQGDKYITGTVDPAAKRVAIYVNGTLIRYASVTGSSYSIYATDITTLRTVGQTFEVVAVNASGQEGDKTSSTVNAKPAVELPAPILKAFYRGDKAITGTVDANAKKIALYVNGVFVRYGSITGTSYSIYASDVALLKTVGQTFEVVAVNESGVEGKRTMGTVVSKETVVTPTDVTTKSSYAAGSVTGVATRVGLYVDGTLVRYGSITDGQYKVYIQDVAALKTVGKEFELRFLDSDSTVIHTLTQTVK